MRCSPLDIGANITSVIISIVTALSTIITVVIQTKKNSKAIEETSKATRELLEVNDYKTYLLLLIADYPDKVDEILYVARHYFEELNGNSFVLHLFGDWLDSKKIIHPEWFLEAKRKHAY